MPQTGTAAQITQIATVVVPVSNHDRAISFFGRLGFTKFADFDYADGERWVEVECPGAATRLTFACSRAGRAAGIETGVILNSADIDADHAALRALGIRVDEAVTRQGDPMFYWAGAAQAGVPPMFRFYDPDDNSYLLVQDPARL